MHATTLGGPRLHPGGGPASKPPHSEVAQMKRVLTGTALLLVGFAASCQSGGERKEVSLMDAPAAGSATPPPPGQAVRVGGNDAIVTVDAKGNYRAPKVSLDTPLPEGYPAPTPPGAIELKTYPAVRRAEVTGESNPDRGMNQAFWPLFRHIQGHDIAMTTPVEVDYKGLEGRDDSEPDSWTMAFLYRTPDLNGTGQEGKVTVRDAAPVTVVSAGVRGDYGMGSLRKGMEVVEQWLGENPQWEAAGDWRMLNYNGPQLRWWNKWAEVQIPVRRRGT
jgi:hypothetical protein